MRSVEHHGLVLISIMLLVLSDSRMNVARGDERGLETVQGSLFCPIIACALWAHGRVDGFRPLTNTNFGSLSCVRERAKVVIELEMKGVIML